MGPNENIWIGAGVVSRDPDVRQVGSSRKVRLSVAVVRRRKAEGEYKEFTTYVPVVMWLPQAGVLSVQTGTKVFVRGEFRTDVYDKKDGSGKGYDTYIHALEITPLDGSPYADETSQVQADGDAPF